MAASLVEIRIFGLPEVDRVLRGFEPKLRRKIITRAIRKGMKVLAEGVKSRLVDDTGTAIKAVIVRAWKKRGRGRIALEVRFDVEPIKALSPKSIKSPEGFFYPAVIEYGSVKHNRMAYAPIRRTYAEDGPKAEAVARQELIAGVNQETKG